MPYEYQYAQDVLPPELHQEISKYYTGKLIVLPYGKLNLKEVRETVIELSGLGISPEEISQKVGRSKRRVQQIIAEEAGSLRMQKLELEDDDVEVVLPTS